MDYQPKVTIIIPVYNGADFLSQAIEAALHQTYGNLEILVVNDGSCDDGESERIALSYKERILYFRKENGGVSSALNYALERMSGEWFSWLSHDDLYYPEKIEKQVAFLNTLEEAERDRIAVHCATESIDRDGNVIKTPRYRDLPIKEDTLETIIGNVYNYRLSGCSFLLPRTCWQELGGFREDIRTVSDVEYWYRLLFAGYQFYCMKEDILVQNRSHGKQVGKTKVSLFQQELDMLYISIADRLASYPGIGCREMQRFYLGLEKRSIQNAARYTREAYLKNTLGAVQYCILLPGKVLIFRLWGYGRSLLRYIFRKIYVR